MMERRGSDGDPHIRWTVVVGGVGAILVLVVILLLESYYHRVEEEEFARKVVAQAPEELARLRAAQQETLHSYRWIDREKGVLAIPIERAMELLSAELGASSVGEPAAPRRRP